MTAPATKVGRSGGSLEIQADYAEGNLNVFLRGENGGSGAMGASPDLRLRGAKGDKGLDAILVPRGDIYHCSRLPANGSRGAKGSRGYRGLDGLPGGSTGKLTLNIKYKDKMNLHIHKVPGLGGVGGMGGDGGEGGDGGDPGSSTLSTGEFVPIDCSRAMKGPQGEKGEVGPQGNTGPIGRADSICEINKEEKICY
jgi:hypothetical protein